MAYLKQVLLAALILISINLKSQNLPIKLQRIRETLHRLPTAEEHFRTLTANLRE